MSGAAAHTGAAVGATARTSELDVLQKQLTVLAEQVAALTPQ